MSGRKRDDRDAIRTAVLTLRLTREEMLRFQVAALGLRKKRSVIVRERVADLIGAALAGARGCRLRTLVVCAPATADITTAVVRQHRARDVAGIVRGEVENRGRALAHGPNAAKRRELADRPVELQPAARDRSFRGDLACHEFPPVR